MIRLDHRWTLRPPFPARSGSRPRSPSPGGRRSSRRCGPSFPAARARAAGRRWSPAIRARGRAASCASSHVGSPAKGRPCSTVTRRGRRLGLRCSRLPSSISYGTPSRRCCASTWAPVAAELTRLMPELVTRVGELPAPAMRPTPDAERQRLHTAVTDLLVGVSSEAPRAPRARGRALGDASTLQLMRHLVRSGAAARMLLVATFRDADADMPAELAEALVDVYRTEGRAHPPRRLVGERDRRVRPVDDRGRAHG